MQLTEAFSFFGGLPDRRAGALVRNLPQKCAILSTTLALLLPGLRATIAEAPPTSPGNASLRGHIDTTATLQRIAAIDRQWADVLKTSQPTPQDPFVYEGAIDLTTGNFHIDHLLPGRNYDLVIWTRAGDTTTRWEGVAMDYHRPIRPAEPATPEDRKWLEHFVTDMPAFYDKSRVLHMAADHGHATLLVELARTRDFHSDKGGEIIYRIELWYFENLFGGWAKDKNTEKVLVRWRGPGNALNKNWQFLATLGGISIDSTGKSEPLEIALPPLPSQANGLAGGAP